MAGGQLAVKICLAGHHPYFLSPPARNTLNITPQSFNITAPPFEPFHTLRPPYDFLEDLVQRKMFSSGLLKRGIKHAMNWHISTGPKSAIRPDAFDVESMFLCFREEVLLSLQETVLSRLQLWMPIILQHVSFVAVLDRYYLIANGLKCDFPFLKVGCLLLTPSILFHCTLALA
jgi:hypothetical protein